MANPVWDGELTYAYYTVALGAVDAKHTTTFNVPRAIQTVTFIFPATATDTKASLEGLSPLDKTTWTAVKAATAPGTFVAVEPVTSTSTTSYVTIPASYIGCGTFRFVHVTDQTSTTPITILFDRMGSR